MVVQWGLDVNRRALRLKFPTEMATPFGKYALQRRIAEGGMAELFLARQSGPDQIEGFEKLVVLKRILPELSKEQAFVRMFLNEARVAARLNHPNIVQLYDLGRVGEQYFIAMEYVHGEDLREVQSQLEQAHAQVPVGLACRIIADALGGLHFAHTRLGPDGKALGLVHRDVSPANVLVTYEGSVKVCDFGIAKATTATSEETQSGLFKGKFSYMSPEQSRGQPLDARSDVFSTGILLWELLTSRRLFKRDNDMASLMAVGKDPVPSPRLHRSDVPVELERIAARALERSLELRYPTAQEMRAELEALIRAQRWEADSLALQRWMRELFAQKLKAQADDIRAAGLASLDDFLLTVGENTKLSWMPKTKTDSSSRPHPVAPASQPVAPAQRVATMYDDESMTTRPERSLEPPPPPPARSEVDGIPTVVLASDMQPAPEPAHRGTVPGIPALASTAPMGWQAQDPGPASTAKRVAYDPPSRWRRVAVIASAALVAGGGALAVVLWPQKGPPPVIAPPMVAAPEPPRATPPPAPPKIVPTEAATAKTATLAITADAPANISVDGAAQPFGREATVEVRVGVQHVVTAQRPGHSVHKLTVPSPSPGERLPINFKLK
jgi:serine/threonine-protein kinase